LLYLHKYVIIICLTWLKNTIMNTHVLNMLHDNDILKLVNKSMFQSTNIELANVEHCTIMTFLHQQ
jgi:hypothetical protein